MNKVVIEALIHPKQALSLHHRTGFTPFDPTRSVELLQKEILRAENDYDTLPPGFTRQIVRDDLNRMNEAGKKLGLL